MDVKLFSSVLGRHKVVVIGGFVLGLVLAIFAYGQPTFSKGKPTIVPRGDEVWQTQSQLLITQQNDPYGNAVNGLTLPNAKASSRVPPLQLGGVGYMASLAPVYAAIANGDVVQRQIRQFTHAATVAAVPGMDLTSGAALPVVQLTVTASSRALGQQVAKLAATALQRYVVGEQAATGIPAVQRVQLSPVQSGFQIKLVKGHKPTVPMLVLVAVLAASITLAFILENHRVTEQREAEGLSEESTMADPDRPSRAAMGAPPAVVAAMSRPGQIVDIRSGRANTLS